MYTSKKTILVGLLLSMLAPGIIRSEVKDERAEFRFSCCSTSSCTETHPELQICGDFFSIETNGGSACDPVTSCVTGEGGIFVDHNGTLSIGRQFRANIGTMITRSDNGVIDLPGNQVFFCSKLGITNWDIDLHDPLQEVIVRADEHLAEFLLNWRNVCKDFDVFCPLVVTSVNGCDCPPVLPCNVNGVPTIEGEVDRLILSGSTMASPVTVKISGGSVGDIEFLACPDVCQVPVGVIIVERDARINFGSSACNSADLCQPSNFGVNGVIIIANGSALITLNEDIVIDNVCSILKGPDFATDDVLRFEGAGCCRTIRVTQTGVLDLRSFESGDIIEFGGNLNVVLEPGAQIRLDGATLRFTDNAILRAVTYPLAQQVFDNAFVEDVIATDPFRVKLIGVGSLEFNGCASFIIEPDAFVGVETLFEVTTSTVCQFAGTNPENCNMAFVQTCEIPVTDITIVLEDSARFLIGTDCPQLAPAILTRQITSSTRSGGSFQVGNTTERPGHSVSFTLLIDGVCAETFIGQGGFFGLNEGIVSKSGVPSNWLIDVLFNVNSITIDVESGVFAHNRIFSSDSPNSSILAIGESGPAVFSLLYSADGDICGGGNVVLQEESCTGPQHPIVREDNDVNEDSCLRVGLLASKAALPAGGVVEVDAVTFFESIVLQNILDFGRSQSLAAVATQAAQCPRARRSVRVGFIFMDEIVRFDATDILGACGCLNLEQALSNCAAFVRVVDADNPEDSSILSNI